MKNPQQPSTEGRRRAGTRPLTDTDIKKIVEHLRDQVTTASVIAAGKMHGLAPEEADDMRRTVLTIVAFDRLDQLRDGMIKLAEQTKAINVELEERLRLLREYIEYIEAKVEKLASSRMGDTFQVYQ